MRNATFNKRFNFKQTKMSIQSDLANRIVDSVPGSTIKKIDKDNYVDIHIPSVNEKKGTHLFFNTSKGKIKMGFYCRDKDFTDNLLVKDSNKSGLEEYSQGIRPFNNPEFENVNDAIDCALLFIKNMGGIEASISNETNSKENEQAITFKSAIEAAQNGNQDKVIEFINQGNLMLQWNEESLITIELASYVSASNELNEHITNAINRGVDLNETTVNDGCGYTALHFAAWDGKIDILDFLLKEGANPNAIGTIDGLTPLYLAAVNGDYNCVASLLKYNADPNIYLTGEGIDGLRGYFSNKGGTVLRSAFINGHFAIAKFLLENGADKKELNEPCVDNDLPATDIVDLVLILKDQGLIQNFDESLYDEIRVILGKDSNSGNTNKPIEHDDELGYPLLAYENSEQNNEYVKRYLRPTKTLNGRMGVKIVIPDWVDVLLDDCVCFDYSEKDIATIREGIDSNKVIPILDYSLNIKGSNLTEIKRMWWLVPFAFWNNTISWLAINKDGLYAPYHGNDDATLILPWDQVTDICFEEEYEPLFADEADSTMNLLTITMDNGGELEISEFLHDDRGSYLSVLYDIYCVRKETIEASKGLSMWKEGAGGEGFRVFPESVELNYLPYWSDDEVQRPKFDHDELEHTKPYNSTNDLKEEYIKPICEVIKMYNILPHFPFIIHSLNEEGYVLDNKSCWFYAQDIQWASNDESWNLLIDHNGFYSTMGEKEFKLLFNWDDVAEIKTRIAEDQSGMTIGLFQADGQHLTLTQSGSVSLLVVYWLYEKIVCDIIENFKDQASISWNFVENELGVQRKSFDSYEELYEAIPPELMN